MSPDRITPDILSRLGEVVDGLDNVLALDKLGPVASAGVVYIIREIRAKAKAIYVEIANDDPWEVFDGLGTL